MWDAQSVLIEAIIGVTALFLYSLASLEDEVNKEMDDKDDDK